MLSTLDRIAAESEDSQGVPNWLSTHPAPADRVEHVRAQVQQMQSEVANTRNTDRNDYLRRIDGLIYGDNPDQGIFRGHQFLHRVLRFAVDFPRDWDVMNSPTQVAGKQPGADVYLILQMVEKPVGRNIEAVALNAMTEAGFTAVDGDRTSINGLDAFVGVYSGTLEGLGQVSVRAAHVLYNERVYMIAGIAPAQLFSRNDRELLASIRSFRPLTAAQAEAIRPNRIDLYTAREGDTWDSIAERYGNGVVKGATLAIMNGSSSSSRPRPGQRLKVVVAG